MTDTGEPHAIGILERHLKAPLGSGSRPWSLHMAGQSPKPMRQDNDPNYDLPSLVTQDVVVRVGAHAGKTRVRPDPDWAIQTFKGTLRHPTNDTLIWHPSDDARRQITDALPAGESQWIGDYLVVHSASLTPLAALLAGLPSIPWAAAASSDPSTDQQSSERDERLLTLDFHLWGQETRLRDAHARLMAPILTEEEMLRGKIAGLQSELDIAEETIVAIPLRRAEVEQVEARLEEVRALYDRHRVYIESQGSANESGADRNVREERWGELEEAEALIHTKEALGAAGRRMSWTDLLTLHVSLMHAPFTILQGAPGVGKTSALQLYAHHMGLCSDAPIPVSPGWMTQEDIFGHYDMLRQEFVAGDLGRVLLAHHPTAMDDRPRRARLAIFDEINLVTIEHVFSNLMSILALDNPRQQSITLHRHHGKNLPPHQVCWPGGLLLAGTANNDHAVIAFSDRFRDRSAVHTIISPPPDELIATSLQLSPEAAVNAEPARDLTCDVWNTWRSQGRSAASTAEESAALDDSLQKLAMVVPDGRLSVRSLRRGADMARHAYRLLVHLGDRVAPELELKPRTLAEDRTQLAASLGLLPTLVQRTVRLNLDADALTASITDFSKVVHPALRSQVEALKS